MTRRANIFAREHSPFVNEWFVPQYGGWFFERGSSTRARLLEQQSLASDGVNCSTLRAIYNALYDREFHRGSYPTHVQIRVDTTAEKLSGVSPFLLGLRQQMTGICPEHVADIVVLATGYRTELPSFLVPVRLVALKRSWLRRTTQLVSMAPKTVICTYRMSRAFNMASLIQISV
ncbi:SidA/IucD/PvdA family monooxygenase [Bradyrhizobium sp. 160]|uniref:SidA/IucD/PvdA family monooxygenase n=1 Tax=Bradyrhizobium sp. 160 TaxID=2782634 RepID=UPI00320AC59F